MKPSSLSEARQPSVFALVCVRLGYLTFYTLTLTHIQVHSWTKWPLIKVFFFLTIIENIYLWDRRWRVTKIKSKIKSKDSAVTNWTEWMLFPPFAGHTGTTWCQHWQGLAHPDDTKITQSVWFFSRRGVFLNLQFRLENEKCRDLATNPAQLISCVSIQAGSLCTGSQKLTVC